MAQEQITLYPYALTVVPIPVYFSEGIDLRMTDAGNSTRDFWSNSLWSTLASLPTDAILPLSNLIDDGTNYSTLGTINTWWQSKRYNVGVTMNDVDISLLVGKTVEKIHGEKGSEELIFVCADGTVFKFYHDQDCCESCSIDDIVGDLNDIVGSTITMAETVSSEDAPPPKNHDSYTWTFYKFATVKGYVTIKWLGESNGYYSEKVSLSIE